jgi:hypothetical protein
MGTRQITSRGNNGAIYVIFAAMRTHKNNNWINVNRWILLPLTCQRKMDGIKQVIFLRRCYKVDFTWDYCT